MAKARSLNKVMLIGNLTRDPVIKETNGGSQICNFGLATNSRWIDANGTEQERTEFHNIVAWNKLAEVCMQILAVGMLVYVEGEMRTHVFTSDDGSKSYKTEVKIEEMKLLDAKGKKGVSADEENNEEPDTNEEAETEQEQKEDDGSDLF